MNNMPVKHHVFCFD